jgi:hypothetical protein
VEHLAQSRGGPFRIEGPMNGVRAVRASSERLGKALLVELVDGALRTVWGLQPRLRAIW